MTLSADDKKALSDVRFAKAREALADAQATLAQKRLNNGDFESISQSEAEHSVQRAEVLLNEIDTLRQRLTAEISTPTTSATRSSL